ncbi:glycosyl hydrolase family 8 [Brevibacillus fortis]|uniref:glycosyl hydrolase family 8 n=1 Tax=Brevibacillus fortis TaxID=2126352 RepID=UPI002E1D2332|nr:glycosyl hydrolase family 8 [Brevibacillus fortis]
MLRDFRLPIIAVALLVLILSGCFFQGVPSAMKSEQSTSSSEYVRLLPGELFIKEHLTNDDLTLKTNLKPATSNDPNVAKGTETLSESLGLWMLYAVEKGDQALFAQNVEIMKAYDYQNGWIAWKAGGENETPVTTNALVDDLRIAEALYMAGEKWGDETYIQLANEIGKSIVENQSREGLLVDFYDPNYKVASDSLTLSYLNASAVQLMEKHQQVSEELNNQVHSFLNTLPTKNGFFPFSYQMGSKEYVYHQEVNLIDQLYIGYHRAQAGMASPELWAFLKDEFARNGLLYGRYDASTKQPMVPYESPAVYSLAILTASELKDYTFARDLYERMVRQQVRRPESEYYGGYMDMSQMDTHSFDNLLPLLAERRLFNEGTLQ